MTWQFIEKKTNDPHKNEKTFKLNPDQRNKTTKDPGWYSLTSKLAWIEKKIWSETAVERNPIES